LLLEARGNLNRAIDELAKDSQRHDTNTIKKKLKEIVPEYAPQENDAVL
jgi:hypothetical protein